MGDCMSNWPAPHSTCTWSRQLSAGRFERRRRRRLSGTHFGRAAPVLAPAGSNKAQIERFRKRKARQLQPRGPANELRAPAINNKLPAASDTNCAQLPVLAGPFQSGSGQVGRGRPDGHPTDGGFEGRLRNNVHLHTHTRQSERAARAIRFIKHHLLLALLIEPIVVVAVVVVVLCGARRRSRRLH